MSTRKIYTYTLNHLPHPQAEHLQSRLFGKMARVREYYTIREPCLGDVAILSVYCDAGTAKYVDEYLQERNVKVYERRTEE